MGEEKDLFILRERNQMPRKVGAAACISRMGRKIGTTGCWQAHNTDAVKITFLQPAGRLDSSCRGQGLSLSPQILSVPSTQRVLAGYPSSR